MSDMLDMDVDLDFDAAIEGISDNAGEALEDILDFIGDETDKVIPFEEGTLMRSKDIKVDKNKLEGAIGYDTPYAIKQHEDQTLTHDPGRKAKYLEATIKLYQAALTELVKRKFDGLF